MDVNHGIIKPLYFIGSARSDLKEFPQTVRDNVGFDLYEVQRGKTPGTAKPLKGFPGVMELVVTLQERHVPCSVCHEDRGRCICTALLQKEIEARY